MEQPENPGSEVEALDLGVIFSPLTCAVKVKIISNEATLLPGPFLTSPSWLFKSWLKLTLG